MKMPSEACLFQTAFDFQGACRGRRGGQRYALSGSDISGKLSVWSETVYFPSAHPPKSISLQRCEQKGRNAFSGFHTTAV